MESREEKESQGKILWKIFISTLYLSAFTFGGGYVIVTLMKKKFVDEYHWIGEDEMLDLVAIAQYSPGAIAVNGAIVVGYKLAGIPGALVAILGTILPPLSLIHISIAQLIHFFCPITSLHNTFLRNIAIPSRQAKRTSTITKRILLPAVVFSTFNS